MDIRISLLEGILPGIGFPLNVTMTHNNAPESNAETLVLTSTNGNGEIETGEAQVVAGGLPTKLTFRATDGDAFMAVSLKTGVFSNRHLGEIPGSQG